MDVVEFFYTVDVLTVYHTYLPKIMNAALNLPNYCKKKSNGLFFVDTMYYYDEKWCQASVTVSEREFCMMRAR